MVMWGLNVMLKIEQNPFFKQISPVQVHFFKIKKKTR